jgi:hypothetical protein
MSKFPSDAEIARSQALLADVLGPEEVEKLEREAFDLVMDRAMEDRTREGFWRYHRCWRCNDGRRACPQAGQGGCEYPRARND